MYRADLGTMPSFRVLVIRVGSLRGLKSPAFMQHGLSDRWDLADTYRLNSHVGDIKQSYLGCDRVCVGAWR